MTIQTEMKAPKRHYNSFGKYYYRNCEDILEAVKPLAKKYNAVCLLTDKIKQIGERYYVEATAWLYDCESNDHFEITAYAREEEGKKGMDGSQVTGASSSYARKYALNGLFNIDDTKDSDTTNTGTDKNNAPATPCCDVCGEPIVDYKDDSGKRVSAERHIAGSKAKYGRVLCLDCIKGLNDEKPD